MGSRMSRMMWNEWFGMQWSVGVVWCGVVWCGVVWCSVVQCSGVECSYWRSGVGCIMSRMNVE